MKSIITWIVIIILVVLGVVWLQKSKSAAPADTATTSTETTTVTAPEAGNMESLATTPEGGASGETAVAKTPSAPVVSSVMISNFAFSPKTLTVKKGTTVTWTNGDSAPHTVTATGTAGPKSGTLNKNDTYSYTFDAVGTFPYACSFHSSMQATVIVTE